MASKVRQRKLAAVMLVLLVGSATRTTVAGVLTVTK